MDVAEFAQGISFRFLQPATPRPSGFRALNHLARKAGIHLEMWMTRLPEGQDEMQARLAQICRGPRMSTFAIGAIINRAVEQMSEGHTYLNVGVANGFALLAGMARNPGKTCVGVDEFAQSNAHRGGFLKRFERLRGANHAFYETDFRKYLAESHSQPLGVYVVDGRSTYEDQCDALKLAEPYFARGCLVLADDTNWPHVREANVDFLKASAFEYRTVLDVQTPRTGHPTFWNGIMLFERGKRKSAAGSIGRPRRAVA